jgi:hypothetical protein
MSEAKTTKRTRLGRGQHTKVCHDLSKPDTATTSATNEQNPVLLDAYGMHEPEKQKACYAKHSRLFNVHMVGRDRLELSTKGL